MSTTAVDFEDLSETVKYFFHGYKMHLLAGRGFNFTMLPPRLRSGTTDPVLRTIVTLSC